MSLWITLETNPCPHCGWGGDEIDSWNITHNLGIMADKAGLYQVMWHPAYNTKASDLIPQLEAGLTILRTKRQDMEQYNPANGWGNYDGLLSVVERLLAACRENPGACVRASR